METRKTTMEIVDMFMLSYEESVDNVYKELKKRSDTYLSLSCNIKMFADDLDGQWTQELSERVRKDLKAKMQTEMFALDIEK